jgi:hypothetical protein
MQNVWCLRQSINMKTHKLSVFLYLCEAGHVALTGKRSWDVKGQSFDNSLPLRQMKEQKDKGSFAVCIRRSPLG